MHFLRKILLCSYRLNLPLKMYLYYLCGLFCLIWIDFGEFLVILLISGLLHLSTLIGWVLLVEFSTFTLKFATSKTPLKKFQPLILSLIKAYMPQPVGVLGSSFNILPWKRSLNQFDNYISLSHSIARIMCGQVPREGKM